MQILNMFQAMKLRNVLPRKDTTVELYVPFHYDNISTAVDSDSIAEFLSLASVGGDAIRADVRADLVQKESPAECRLRFEKIKRQWSTQAERFKFIVNFTCDA